MKTDAIIMKIPIVSSRHSPFGILSSVIIFKLGTLAFNIDYCLYKIKNSDIYIGMKACEPPELVSAKEVEDGWEITLVREWKK